MVKFRAIQILLTSKTKNQDVLFNESLQTNKYACNNKKDDTHFSMPKRSYPKKKTK